MLNKNQLKLGLVISLFTLMCSCGGDSADVTVNENGGGGGEAPAPVGFDASALAKTTGEDVIVATYQGMADATQVLLDAVTVLTDGNLDSANLQAAQNAWTDARQYWESSEGFLWGPIDTEGFDPKLDDWPVNKVDLDNILADNSIDLGNQGVIEQLETTVKGFHTIEYLLFNDGSGNEDSNGCGAADGGTQACVDNILSALGNARRAAYLEGITVNVNGVVQNTLNAWLSGGGDFLGKVTEAGKGSDVYTGQRAIVEEMIQGLIAIADEVGAGKLGDPFGAGDPLTVESKFSGNSLIDFQFNIRSIRNVYCGQASVGTESAENACAATANGGLASLVSVEDADLHARMIVLIDDATGKIADIPSPYYTAVEASITDATVRQTIQNAIDAVLALNNLLSGELLPMLDDVTFSF